MTLLEVLMFCENNFLSKKLLPLKTVDHVGGKMVEVKHGKALFNNNKKVKCIPLGKIIKIDELLTDHLGKKGKGQGEIRYKRAKFVLQTIKYPQEIWFDKESKRYTLIGQFKIKGTDKIISIVVIVVSTMSVLTCYSSIDNPMAIGKHRKGFLLYPKER